MGNAHALGEALRRADRFHASQDRTHTLQTFFPESPEALALDLSSVTSMFYGLMLQIAGERAGPAAMDTLSREMFYRLGRAKARATQEQKAGEYPFHGDARDIVTVLISAIYNASPEYEFEVEQFGPDRCQVCLSGVDRYYRAANLLGIADALTWPTLHPFFEGVSDELGLGCQVYSDTERLDTKERLRTRYIFARGDGDS